MAATMTTAPADLTERQWQILATIASSVSERGYSPTMREIASAVGLASPSSVKHQLEALETKGYIRRDPKSPRAIVIDDKAHAALGTPGAGGGPGADDEPGGPDEISAARQAGRGGGRPAAQHRAQQAAIDFLGEAAIDTTPVPLVGRIAAGGPILAEQMIEDVFTLPTQLVGSGELFMLQVQGDSMIDAAICDGDWVVVRQQDDADNGQIVAAMIDGEATVKTLRRKDGHQWLMPANSAYTPIWGDDARILGKVVSVLRAL
ncbi:transcriptional repressor LexA [Bowdeniella massiliensis]|uniref:transcriptional repressor LexA n=1 Tax=Bowdeniella massiliensis TaxID=2932264 RepID=UPI002028031D|nr:transcriptional repressor LexA [Bowdeniella massiliensis]